MSAKNVFRVLGLALVALFIFGFVIGAIGSALFGGKDGSPYLPTPEVHLPPQPVFESDAHEAHELHKLPVERALFVNGVVLLCQLQWGCQIAPA